MAELVAWRDHPMILHALQNNLGLALLALGEREAGTARLEEGVAAFRAALEEWTRERVPLQGIVNLAKHFRNE